MTIDDFELLLILLDEGNITKAAERLYTSQSAISYRIKKLEEELDCALFERGKNGITPTAECRLVEVFAKNTLLHYKDLKNQLTNNRSTMEKYRKIYIGTSTTIASLFFKDLLNTYQDIHPCVEMFWRANISKIIMNMLQEKAVDIAIVRGNFEWSQKKALIFEEPMYLVSRRSIDMKKLPEDTLICLPRIDVDINLFRWWESQYGSLPQKIIEIQSIDACLKLVDQDLGFTVLPELSLVKRKNSMMMEQLRWQNGQPLTQKTWCFCRNDCPSYISETFFEYVRSTLPKLMSNTLYGIKV